MSTETLILEFLDIAERSRWEALESASGAQLEDLARDAGIDRSGATGTLAPDQQNEKERNHRTVPEIRSALLRY